MDENFYREAIKQSPFGYFYSRIIKDDKGNVIDLIILDINYKFSDIVGLKEVDILGKSILEIVPSLGMENYDWSGYLEEASLGRPGNTTERYIEFLNGWFKIYGFPYGDDCIVIQLVEINKKEPFMSAIIDTLPFAAWAKDKEGSYIAVNKRYEKDIKLKSEKIIGKNDLEIWPVNLARRFMDEDEEVIRKRIIKHINEFYVNNMWYETYKSGVYDEKGNVVGTIGFSINITEEKRLKGEVEHQKRLLKLILDSIPDFIFYKDIDGTYLGLNDSAARMYFGKGEEEIIGKNDKELDMDNDDLETIIRQDLEIAKEGKIKIYEGSMRLKDGSKREYETIKAPFFDSNDNIVGILGISRDITKRKIAEKKLMESEEKFRQLAENVEGVFFVGEDNKITYVSPGYEKIFRRSSDSLYDNPESFFENLHPEDMAKLAHIRHKAVCSKDCGKIAADGENKCFDETFRIVRPDGEIRWIWLKGFPVKDEYGNVIRVVSIGEDITTIKEAEREIERLRTEFFANLSHEFRTPLTLIFNSIQMIELQSKRNIDGNMDNSNKYLKIIKQNSFRLLRLVNNLIDSTKIDAGFVEYCPENYDIVTFVRDISDSVAEFIRQKGMELVFTSCIDKRIIAFDPDKVERIMLNLLSNAIKFNVPGGRIEVSISSQEKFIQISVKDTGIGIPEDKLTSIFERFKQIQNRLTKISEGSGIGLSLVKSLAEMHGGTIEAKSTLDKGSELIVRLPDVIAEGDNVIDYVNKQIVYNSSVDRIQIEFSDIYGMH